MPFWIDFWWIKRSMKWTFNCSMLLLLFSLWVSYFKELTLNVDNFWVAVKSCQSIAHQIIVISGDRARILRQLRDYTRLILNTVLVMTLMGKHFLSIDGFARDGVAWYDTTIPINPSWRWNPQLSVVGGGPRRNVIWLLTSAFKRHSGFIPKKYRPVNRNLFFGYPDITAWTVTDLFEMYS